MNPGNDEWSTSEGITRALFDCVNDAAAECLAEMEREPEAAVVAAQVPRPIRRRTYVRCEHDVAHQRLFDDYLSSNHGGARRFFTTVLECGEIFLSALSRRWRHVMNTSSIGKKASADPDLRRCRSARLCSGSWPTTPRRICSTSTFTSGGQMVVIV